LRFFSPNANVGADLCGRGLLQFVDEDRGVSAFFYAGTARLRPPAAERFRR
jgi:hypothetical protein